MLKKEKKKVGWLVW